MSQTPRNDRDLANIVADLLGYIDRRVDERLAERGIPSGAVEVFTKDHLPPGYTSPESFAWACRKYGFDKVTCRSGRGWAVPSETWFAARRDEVAQRRKPAEPTEMDHIDAMLATRLRLVRKPGCER